mmetsp:Transcript_20540/g.35424  ORF Transcript_20540/g.35424 Transcript_20540/m.35424 type:complete len:102 (+) Transcript_20540:121-426(+)|eukprot:CAMPEP_0184692224 /NCGR_PEP_ID=MMETSP0313-20130426/791_1 /TAXON_ID=2792 /ORGANISM="Porphyridium aerugineum, Strain SAG 1380-2" /LENGTH=101 /DNA_ID=CAMNT_0027150039 /DNA_START=100 /DNA_END=405 /DNA_ORIENTATION=+
MSSFAKIWLKPEVYPVVAAVAVGCGFSAYIITRKSIFDPSVTLSKSDRTTGLHSAYESKEVTTGWWSRFKESSPRILDKQSYNPIMANKRMPSQLREVDAL